MRFNNLTVVGLGYIGLPTAAMFSSKGLHVLGVDINEHVVNTINNGEIHIVEPGLSEIVKSAVDAGLLSAAMAPEPSDAFFICVPTPFLPLTEGCDFHEPDLFYIESAARSISKVLKKGDIVILESTSPVGTTEKLVSWLSDLRHDLVFPTKNENDPDVNVAYCPERVLPGSVIRELLENDRVIGGITKKCALAARDLYNIFVEGDCSLTNARTAEMVKLTENASRDVSIAFANELSVICDSVDINVWELIKLSNLHPRVNILQPGPGVGGHCIAVDPWFIVSRSPNEARLIKEARKINDSKPAWVLGKLKTLVQEFLMSNAEKSLADVIIACYGLTFKANIDDLRESPARLIASGVISSHQGTVLLIEPNISEVPKGLAEGILTDFDYASEKADIHLLLVDHTEFMNKRPKLGLILDTRGIWG
jgi:UDP-N-acetyl-D-mannosaminuronic acid dehydrogenase